jgi:hypothetical protein
MRIGLLRTWCGGRYLPFWRVFLQELGLELVEADQGAEADLEVCGPIRRVLGEVQSLKRRVDYLLLPDLQLGVESLRGGGQCPWLASLETALRFQVPDLPPLLRVPGELGPQLMSQAVEIGQLLTQNPPLVRRAWERSRYLLHPPAPSASLGRGIGIVAQPYIREDPTLQGGVEEALRARGLHPLWPSLEPARLREEGLKSGVRLDLPTDLELAGASWYFARSGSVEGIVYLSANRCDPIPSLARKLARSLTKPWAFLVVGEDWSEPLGRLVQELSMR